MTVAVDDPLIAQMSIGRTLPLHESSRRLRALHPDRPRVHGVAVMADVSRRRWWPLTDALTGDRLHVMFDTAAAETENRAAVAHQLAATLAHVVIGRVMPLLLLEGRAWDTGLENLWVHVDSDGAIDWVGVVDPTIRALPDDEHFGDQAGQRRRQPGLDRIVALPSEAALATWVAHRSHRSLQPLFSKLEDVGSGFGVGTVTASAMWHIVGTTVVSTATRVPLLAGASELTGMRRGQAVLDALMSFGAPVRGARQGVSGKACLIRAALPIVTARAATRLDTTVDVTDHRTAAES